jgi:ABC-type Fe3+ transport system substrate-binding protein
VDAVVAVLLGQVVVNPKAPHPKAARIAANYLLSKEGQTAVAKYGRLPVRADVTPTPPDAISKMGEVKLMPLEFSPEEEKLWQKRYQDYLRGR